MTLTRDSILSMEASKELDALVAEKVMGWDSSQFHFDDEMGITERLKYNEFMGDDIWVNFNPSTDISAAWEVVDVYPVMKIEQIEIYKGNKNVKVTAWSGFDHHDEVEVYAKTATEAICKAALLACLEGET